MDESGLNLNHRLGVYGRAVALKWPVREMFGQRVKQKDEFSAKMFSV